jgi:mRNA interferase MazF
MTKFGHVVRMVFPVHNPRGHEQEGERPCVIIVDPSTVQQLRFPKLLVAPITRRLLPLSPLRVQIGENKGGLKHPGTILLDQLRMLDADRLTGSYGQLEGDELETLYEGLRLLLKDAIKT